MTALHTAAGDATELIEGYSGRLWKVRPDPDLAGFADAGDGLPHLLRVLLARRGIADTESARAFLGSPRPLGDAGTMPGLRTAVDRLAMACSRGERVAVLGDFDVDGLTSTTILVETLEALGAVAIPYVPHRFHEGYGPNINAVRSLADRGASVLVTVDCGMSAVEEIAEANSLDMDVLVLDHHSAPTTLPDALAVVNPKLPGSLYGSEPAAVGVAYRVSEELRVALGAPADDGEHLALAALGTVCDMVPLDTQNRDIVRTGIEALRRSSRPGLAALAEIANAPLGRASADTCGWVIGPRLNAAGRMAHGKLALDLLLAKSSERAGELARELEALNQARRERTSEGLAAALSSLSEDGRSAPLVFVASEDVSMGIVGLIAGRLAEQCHRPSIVMQLSDGEGRASCRSIPGFDVTAMLARNAALFLRYGGHAAAAGFTIAAERLDEVRTTLSRDAEQHLPDLPRPTLEVDAELPPRMITRRTLQWLKLLGPHGPGNPRPQFLARGVRAEYPRPVGADGDHVTFRLRDDRLALRAIAFRTDLEALGDGNVDVLYTLREDGYGPVEGALSLEVLDARPAERA